MVAVYGAFTIVISPRDWYNTNVGDPNENPNGMDIVYTYVWSNFNDNIRPGGTACKREVAGSGQDSWKFSAKTLFQSNKEGWFESPCIEENIRAIMTGGEEIEGAGSTMNQAIEELNGSQRNPWRQLEISNTCQDLFGTVTSEATDYCSFSTDDLGNWNGWFDDDESEDFHDVRGKGGGNVTSLYLDVNDEGYIQAVYYLVYLGADQTWDDDQGFEPTARSLMHLDVHVGESCNLIAESVGQTGANTAWSNRANGQGSYELDNGSTFAIPDYEPFSSIVPYGIGIEPDSTQFDGVLFDPTGSVRPNGRNVGIQPILFNGDSDATNGDSDATNGGNPQTCIGDCETRYCVGNLYTQGVPCTSDSECVGNAKDGVEGVCTGVGNADLSGSQQGVAASSSADQLNAAGFSAVDNLKYIFADINNFFELGNPNAQSAAYQRSSTQFYDTDGDGNSIFREMQPCDSDGNGTLDGEGRPNTPGEDTEYCGVYPVVNSISVDGNITIADGYYEIDNGTTVTLEFTPEVDDEQEALDYIEVDWGDGSQPVRERWDADDTTQVFTHAYSCGPGYGAFDLEEGSATCEFWPTVTVVDHWQWCSGERDTNPLEGPFGSTRLVPASPWAGVNQNQRHDGSESKQDLRNQCGTYDAPNFIIRVDGTN